ncbi:MAG: hypothetical protein RXQ79_04090 [Acidilobus sp.]
MIRIRSLDIKGLVNKTYELLRSGDWDMLGRESIEFSKSSHGRMWPGPSKGFGGDSERRMTRTEEEGMYLLNSY